MITKKCRKCDRELDISEFFSYKSSPDSYMHICKSCHGRKNVPLNPLPEKYCKYCGIHINSETSNPRKGRRKLNTICKTCEKIKKTEYRKRNREILKEKSKLNNKRLWEKIKSDPEKLKKNKERNKKYRDYNKEKCREYSRNSYYRNHSEIRKRKNEYQKSRRHISNEKRRLKLLNDPAYKLKHNIRWRIHSVLKGYKNKSTMELIGCDLEFLKNYIQLQFTENMSWGNHGTVWHLDHAICLSEFDILNENEQRIALHYTNLRPLDAKLNMSKRGNIPRNSNIFWNYTHLHFILILISIINKNVDILPNFEYSIQKEIYEV